MIDLMYFGYGYGSEEPSARQYKIDFAKEVREKFPNVELRNADDEIKGYRYEVHLDDKESEDYYAFLFGKGWFDFSLIMNRWKYINSIKVSPMRIIALILLIIAWSNGQVSGILAWILLLLIVDISFDWKPRR